MILQKIIVAYNTGNKIVYKYSLKYFFLNYKFDNDDISDIYKFNLYKSLPKKFTDTFKDISTNSYGYFIFNSKKYNILVVPVISSEYLITHYEYYAVSKYSKISNCTIYNNLEDAFKNIVEWIKGLYKT